MLTKECSKCGETKSLDLFPQTKRPTNQCKECRRKKQQEFRKDNPDYAKNYYWDNRDYWLDRNKVVRITRHGITLEQYNDMLLAQENKCAICTRIFTDTPHIDHDHNCCPKTSSCGRCVRGLLCGDCNPALGAFGDSIETLEAAIRYLKERNG